MDVFIYLPLRVDFYGKLQVKSMPIPMDSMSFLDLRLFDAKEKQTFLTPWDSNHH